jgi:hypothetical protein
VRSSCVEGRQRTATTLTTENSRYTAVNNSLSQSGMLTRARPGNLKPFHSGVGKAAMDLGRGVVRLTSQERSG